MAAHILVIELDGMPGCLQGLLVSTGAQECRGKIRLMRQRIQLAGAFLERDGFIVPFERRTEAPIEVIRIGTVWIQFDGPDRAPARWYSGFRGLFGVERAGRSFGSNRESAETKLLLHALDQSLGSISALKSARSRSACSAGS
jgi:hypothetical protein